MNYKLIFVCVIICFLSCQTKEHKEHLKKQTIRTVDNHLKGTTWHINQLLCLDENLPQYFLHKKDSVTAFEYGDFISFSDSINFTSYYTAPCGNDCFRTVYGKYTLLTKTEISFQIDSITYDGMCYQTTECRTDKIMQFTILTSDNIDSFELIKLKN